MTTLVLLPGMDGTGAFFSEFVAALGDRVETIVGHYPPDPALRYAELEAIARSFLPQDRPFVLLGESFSGPIAISIAASAPRHLVGLILCCTFARLPRFGPPALRALLQHLPAVALPIPLASWLLLGKYKTAPLQAQLKVVLAQVPPRVLQARFQAILNVDVSRALSLLRVPVLYLRATDDHVVPEEAADYIKACYPSTQIRDFAAPHGLLQTRRHESAAVVCRFLDDVSQEPAFHGE